MSVLADIRQALADRLSAAGIDGSINVFAHMVEGAPLPHVMILPATDTYVEYHGSFGPGRNMTVNLIARVVYPLAGSPQSGDVSLDGFLSSGTLEDASIVDVFAGDAELPDGAAYTVYAGTAANHLFGQYGNEATPVASCEVPLLVQIYRR